MAVQQMFLPFFFFNDTATTEIYTLSLHDALPICEQSLEDTEALRRRILTESQTVVDEALRQWEHGSDYRVEIVDRKSTRLNSSHVRISYAVFCLKKKKKNYIPVTPQQMIAEYGTD